MSNHTAQTNWRDNIKTLCQQDINPHERQMSINLVLVVVNRLFVGG